MTRSVRPVSLALAAKPITIHRDDTILTISVHREYSEQEQLAHLAELHDIMEQGKPSQVYRWVVINDLRTPILGSAIHRKHQANWMLAHDDEIRHRTSGIGFVMTSTIMRVALTGVFWLAPLAAPHAIFTSLTDAKLWALERNRIPISPAAKPARGS